MGTKKYKEFMTIKNGMVIIVTKDNGLWHLSASYDNKLPTYDEMKELRYRYIPDDINMAMIFPPKNEFVNVHPYCLHLWQI